MWMREKDLLRSKVNMLPIHLPHCLCHRLRCCHRRSSDVGGCLVPPWLIGLLLFFERRNEFSVRCSYPWRYVVLVVGVVVVCV